MIELPTRIGLSVKNTNMKDDTIEEKQRELIEYKAMDVACG
jgi:hypothetical protein